MPFRITIGDRSILTEDLTLDELVDIEKDAGESWLYVVAAPLKTAVGARAIARAFLARTYGEDEAVKRAGQLTVKQLTSAFEVVEDDRPEIYENGAPQVDPKAGTGEQATT